MSDRSPNVTRDALADLMPDPDRRSIALGAIAWAVAHSDTLWPGIRLVGGLLVNTEYLTPQETRVVEAASRGLRNHEIAVLLGVSLDSVKHHLKKAQRALRAKNRAHLVAEALRMGLIS